MLFNVKAIVNQARGIVDDDKSAEKAKKAEQSAEMTARIAADVKILRAWGVLWAGMHKAGVTLANLPAVVLFSPTRLDLNAIAAAWANPQVKESYVSHNRADRAKKAIEEYVGDALVIGSAKSGGEIIRTTPETKSRGAGGYIFSEKARAYMIERASADFVKEIASLAKLYRQGDETGDYSAFEDAANALMIAASADAEKDALNDAQIDRYMANREKPAAKRISIADVLGETPETAPIEPQA